jgi:hypothetical protein
MINIVSGIKGKTKIFEIGAISEILPKVVKRSGKTIIWAERVSANINLIV